MLGDFRGIILLQFWIKFFLSSITKWLAHPYLNLTMCVISYRTEVKLITFVLNLRLEKSSLWSECCAAYLSTFSKVMVFRQLTPEFHHTFFCSWHSVHALKVLPLHEEGLVYYLTRFNLGRRLRKCFPLIRCSCARHSADVIKVTVWLVCGWHISVWDY